MTKRNSLEHFALFYEKIENSKLPNDTSLERSNNSYEKTPSLSEDDIHKLNEDAQNPMRNAPKTNPIDS